MTTTAVHRAAQMVLETIASDPRYAHTSHLQIRHRGAVILDEHLRGPLSAPVFSVTKSVLATVLATMSHQGVLPDVHSPIADVLPGLRRTPAARHTWHQVLTMTRGAATDGAWDIDAVLALPAGHVDHIAAAPQEAPPGERFAYDNGGPHLISAAASQILGESVAAWAGGALFEPLGVDGIEWDADPEGHSVGGDGVRATADTLGRLGQLWLDSGRWNTRQLLGPEFFTAMTQPHTPGGPPENAPYGYLLWLPPGRFEADGWAGQHIIVVPAAQAVVVTTGDPGFEPGPPPRDQLPPDWRPAAELVRTHLVPALTASD